MGFEVKDTLEDRLAHLEQIIRTMGMVQLEIVDVLVKEYPKLQSSVIAAILSLEDNRSNFTEWLNDQDNVPDDVKTFMMDVNEGILDFKEELEDE